MDIQDFIAIVALIVTVFSFGYQVGINSKRK